MSDGQNGVIVAKLLDSLQSNLAANQALLAQMLEQQRQTSTALTQIVEVQRDLGRKVALLESIPDLTRSRVVDGFSQHVATMDRTEAIVEEIQEGLSNGYLRSLREDLSRQLESRTAQTIGSITDLLTVHFNTLNESLKRSMQSLIWRFSFVFGTLGLLLTAATLLMGWLERAR